MQCNIHGHVSIFMHFVKEKIDSGKLIPYFFHMSSIFMKILHVNQYSQCLLLLERLQMV